MSPEEEFMNRYTWRLLPLLLAWLAVAPAALAGTLYDHSEELFAARVKQANPADYTFVVMGDSRGDDAVFRKALATAAAYKPLFILHGGDISENGSREELDHFLDVVREEIPNLPLFVVLGNHERDRKLFEEKIGPRNFVIDSQRLNSLVIAVDNADYALKSPALSYLREHLKHKRATAFVAMHVPPKTERWDWHTFSDGGAELVRLIGERKPDMVFFSHVHQYAGGVIAGVPAIITGGAGAPLVGKEKFPGEPLHHLIVVRVRQGKVSAEMVRL
jgi:3',5'-cyclic-AMP phosphodiesterase